MPWQLTTPYSGGDLDPTGVYNQVKIVDFSWRTRRTTEVSIMLEYGTTVEDEWIRGMVPADKPQSVTIRDAAYDALIAHVSNDGELTYASVKRGMYEQLSADDKLDPGSIV